MMRSIIFVTLGLLSSAVYYMLSTLQPTYPVHTHGAVLITGCSTGIGRDAAITLAQTVPTYTVYAGVRQTKDVDILEGLKIDNLRPIILDVTNISQIEDAVKTIESSNLPFVALVNNAGIMNRAPLEIMPMDVVKKMYDVNVFGLMQTTQAFLPLIRKSQGRIVNLGSMIGVLVVPGLSGYGGTKFAVEAITDALRRELAALNVSVSLIRPGVIRSRINRKHKGEEPTVDQNTTHHHHDVVGFLAPLTKELGQVYSRLYKAAETTDKQVNALAGSTDFTSEAIIHAIRSPKPLSRYTVGPAGDISTSLLLWIDYLLPDRAMDFLVANPDIVVGKEE